MKLILQGTVLEYADVWDMWDEIEYVHLMAIAEAEWWDATMPPYWDEAVGL